MKNQLVTISFAGNDINISSEAYDVASAVAGQTKAGVEKMFLRDVERLRAGTADSVLREECCEGVEDQDVIDAWSSYCDNVQAVAENREGFPLSAAAVANAWT